MFDFVSAGRIEGGVMCRNDKGLVTSDRSLKKDAFYFYKANWSDQPVLYITSRRFTERSGHATDMKVYSNAEQVDLAVNGKKLGKPARAGDRVFVWKEVPLSSGANRFTATARFACGELTDVCVWTAP
jgi:beta-galactosidase